VELSISEQLLFATVKLKSCQHGFPVSTGTGFFYKSDTKEGKSIILLVTNKHVVRGSTEIIVNCHLAGPDGASGQFAECTLKIEPNAIINHPSPSVDLCAMFFGPMLNTAQQSGRALFIRAVGKSEIPDDDDWQYFDAIEDVLMIGCPNGISDEVNNFPIVRSGITASSISRKYNGKNEFLVDMACFPGSSGSPIFIFDKTGYLDRKTMSYNFGVSRLKFVGILYSGPIITNDGRIILSKEPTVEVRSMMHLGNAIRSSEIFELEAEMHRAFGAEIT